MLKKMVKYAEKIVKYAEKWSNMLKKNDFEKISFLGADVPLALIPPPPNVTFCHTFLHPLPPPNCGRRLWMAPKVITN